MGQSKKYFSLFLGLFSTVLVISTNTNASELRCYDIFSVPKPMIANTPNDLKEISVREQLIQRLSKEEFSMIQSYTHTGFGEMNDMLRGVKSSDSILKVCGQGCLDLISALGKMPSYRGKVYRGTELSQDQISEYLRVGAIVVEKGFLSTSKSRKISEEYDGNARFIIKSSTGREVENISVSPYEKEVIFLPGTRFRVTKVVGQFDEATIYLEEVN